MIKYVTVFRPLVLIAEIPTTSIHHAPQISYQIKDIIEMKRIKDVCDSVKEYTGKTLALKQIEGIEALRDKLMEQEEQMS